MLNGVDRNVGFGPTLTPSTLCRSFHYQMFRVAQLPPYCFRCRELNVHTQPVQLNCFLSPMHLVGRGGRCAWMSRRTERSGFPSYSLALKMLELETLLLQQVFSFAALKKSFESEGICFSSLPVKYITVRMPVVVHFIFTIIPTHGLHGVNRRDQRFTYRCIIEDHDPVQAHRWMKNLHCLNNIMDQFLPCA